MIVLNENEWAAEMIRDRSLGSKPYETICRVAKYYNDVDGLSKKDIRRKIEEFLLMCEPTTSIPKWSDMLDKAVARALKYKAVEIEYLPVYKEELEKIDALSGRQLQRLAFTLLCLSKYWDIVSTNKDHWVNNKDSEIMKMANINTSIKRQSGLYYTLRNDGMIQFSKKVDNTNVKVLFGGGEEEVIRVTDLRNLGYQYLMYRGEPYFVCESCGLTTKIRNPGKGRRQKYCDECAAKMWLQQSINSVMRKRNAT